MSKYFNNRRSLQRHHVVPSSVSNGAFRNFLKAVKSPWDPYFLLKANNETTTFPVIEFKSKLAPSDTIEIPKNLVRVDQDRRMPAVRFFPMLFEFDSSGWIMMSKLRQPLPPLTTAIRLQRLRGGLLRCHPSSTRMTIIDHWPG